MWLWFALLFKPVLVFLMALLFWYGPVAPAFVLWWVLPKRVRLYLFRGWAYGGPIGREQAEAGAVPSVDKRLIK